MQKSRCVAVQTKSYCVMEALFFMGNIYLYWHKVEGEYGNFGDELGPYIIRNLSGEEIYHVPIPRSSIKLILAYIKGLISNYYSTKIVNQVVKTLLLNGRYIISAGSIIGVGSGKRIVWGSGLLSSSEKIDDGQFLAVRGKYTQDRLKVFGDKAPDVIGDPALLLPLICKYTVEKKYKLGIIPHHIQYKNLIYYEQKNDIKVINLIGDIEKIIKEITNCEYVISTSLHGIIVAHAYGIPALWYEYPKIKLLGDSIKFLDYFTSVEIPEYEPYLLKEIDEFNMKSEIDNVKNNIEKATIQVDLSLIQKRLLNVAPFPILEQFKFTRTD